MTPTIDERMELLRGVWLFSECTDEELGFIAALARPRSADAGVDVIREGEPGDSFFVIVGGRAAARVDGDTIETLEVGSFFGEISLLDGGERLATVTAETPLDLLVLSRHDFNEMLAAAMPEVTPKLLQVVGERMRILAAHEGKPTLGY